MKLNNKLKVVTLKRGTPVGAVKEGDVFEHVAKNNKPILIKAIKGRGCVDCCFCANFKCTFECRKLCNIMRWDSLVFVEDRS